MRIGVIGKGNFTTKVLSSLKTIDTMEVVGGFETQSFESFDIFQDLDDLLFRVDTIVILDFLSSDYSTLSYVIKNGKNLYIENAGFCSRRELRNLEMLARESGTAIQIGLKQRFYSFYDDLVKYNLSPRIIESKRLVKFNKNSTQLSVIDDLMIHDIDVALQLAHAEVKSIYSTAVGVYYNDPDVVNTRIEFYNGCVANLSVSKISNKETHRTNFFQNNTFCTINFHEQVLKVQSNTGSDDGSGEEWGVKTTYSQAKDSDGYVSMLSKELNSFYNCIAKNVEPIAGISQYLQLQSVTDKIKQQLERNYTTNA